MARRARPRSPLPHVAILTLAATAAGMGCQFSPGSLSGNGDTPDAMTVPDDAPLPPPDAPQPPDDASQPPDDASQPPDASVLPTPDAGPPADAAPLPNPNTLVSRGLLTRYLIDEDTDGIDTTTLDDSGPNPRLLLAINYDGQGEFIDEDNHRGLRWNAITTDGRAIADLAEDGKVWLGLDGSTTGTIEMVVDVAAFLSGSRLSHIGEDDDTGVFTLRIDEPESFAFAWNNSGRVAWAADVNGLGRAVVHVVLDSRRASPDERVRLYVNGVELTRTSGSPPNLNEAIDIVTESSTAYSIGNTEEGDRGVQATFYYASMYSAALDPAEIAHNFDILVADDDGPGR